MRRHNSLKYNDWKWLKRLVYAWASDAHAVIYAEHGPVARTLDVVTRGVEESIWPPIKGRTSMGAGIDVTKNLLARSHDEYPAPLSPDHDNKALGAWISDFIQTAQDYGFSHE